MQRSEKDKIYLFVSHRKERANYVRNKIQSTHIILIYILVYFESLIN